MVRGAGFEPATPAV